MAMPEALWDPTEFQKVVADFLDRQDWSQNRLATEMKISQTAVNRWFQPIDKDGPGRVTRPRPEQLQILARIMGVPLNDLMRMCNYPVEQPGRGKDTDPRLRSLQTMIESAYAATDDEQRRMIGLDAIYSVVQSVWSAHPRRRTGARREGPSAPSTPDSVPRLSYA